MLYIKFMKIKFLSERKEGEKQATWILVLILHPRRESALMFPSSIFVNEDTGLAKSLFEFYGMNILANPIFD